jgi:transposase
MIIIGVDFHPESQQIAWVDTETGELQEKRLAHREEAERFYRELAAAWQNRVGMEASGHGRWFERLLSELQVELWIGDAAEIRTRRVRKQKTDRTETRFFANHQKTSPDLRRTATICTHLTLSGIVDTLASVS